MIPQKVALSVDEMAQAIGISRTVAYRLVKTKGFPVVQLTEKRMVIPVDALKKWLEENMRGGDIG